MSAPRVTSSPEPTGNVVRDSALGLVPETVDPYLALNYQIWNNGPLTPAELEMIRLRNARKVGCVFCQAVRYDIATEAGLNEAKVQKIEDGFQNSDLSQREKLILRFADQYLDNPDGMSSETERALQAEFSAAELTHMSVSLVLFNTFSRIAVALGGMPEGELPLIPMAVPE